MRKPIEPQFKLGEINIADIQFNPKDRDEIPQLLRGLQHIYCDPELREQVFTIMETGINQNRSGNTGRPGMELWKILVFGTLRLNCDWDYDKLKEIADNHMTLRKMIGIGMMDDEIKFPLSTLRDNVRLLTPEMLEEINTLVVTDGHQLVKKNDEDVVLNGRCDSFVVETDVEYPTDRLLLFTAVRKLVEICASSGIGGWRQAASLMKKLKKILRKVQKLNAAKSDDPAKKQQDEEKKQRVYTEYLDFSRKILRRVDETSAAILLSCDTSLLIGIEHFKYHADLQVDQITRRVFKGEKIPHAEKVFSVFQPHTRWIQKGKAGVPFELGLPVCIVEDQYGFILHHCVMETEVDVDIAVPIIEKTKGLFPNLASCSFDKGFHSPENQIALRKVLDSVILPKKGRLGKTAREHESTEEFQEARRRHSRVESAINALENHGLDRCLDHGLCGFKRYVALSVLARNVQQIGRLLLNREAERAKQRKASKAA